MIDNRNKPKPEDRISADDAAKEGIKAVLLCCYGKYNAPILVVFDHSIVTLRAQIPCALPSSAFSARERPNHPLLPRTPQVPPAGHARAVRAAPGGGAGALD